MDKRKEEEQREIKSEGGGFILLSESEHVTGSQPSLFRDGIVVVVEGSHEGGFVQGYLRSYSYAEGGQSTGASLSLFPSNSDDPGDCTSRKGGKIWLGFAGAPTECTQL